MNKIGVLNYELNGHLLFRKLLLYPTELRGLTRSYIDEHTLNCISNCAVIQLNSDQITTFHKTGWGNGWETDLNGPTYHRLKTLKNKHQENSRGWEMARINIEDTVFKDKRFTKLCIELGSRTMALGALVEAFMVSQEYATPENPECLVPLNKWQKEDLPDALFETGWAEIKDEQVYVRGSKECHAWLIQKRAAGSKGGQKTKKSATPRLSGAKRVKAARSGANPLTLTLPLSPTLSTSSVSVVENSPNQDSSDLNRKIWDSYSTAYLNRYKTEPVRNAKTNGQVAQLGKRLGEEAPEVVEFYLTHNKTYYVSKLHDLGLCLSDAEALRTQWFHGKAITQADIKNFERQVERDNLLDKIEAGEI